MPLPPFGRQGHISILDICFKSDDNIIMKHVFLKVFAVSVVIFTAIDAKAIEFFFAPDSSFGQVGDTVMLSGRIGPSDTLRGFTIYIFNDTNIVDLAEAPAPGSLISGRQGLDFRFADHIVASPEWLEVGATVFSNDYWAGPGELFAIRFVFRQCGEDRKSVV